MKSNELNFLVVEDDDFQRHMVCDLLKSIGIEKVYDANNGQSALALIHSNIGHQIDIIVCDLNMPKMDGMEFMRHLGQERQNVAIILMSALSNKLLISVGQMAKMYGIRLLGVIQKPMILDQIIYLISRFTRLDNKVKISTPPERFALEEILIGIRNKQFCPYFQPKVAFSTGKVIGAEALARWVHPEKGVISPYFFIPLLEQNSKLEELTLIMLEETASACRYFIDIGLPLHFSINLSPESLSNFTFVDKVALIVEKSGIGPKFIVLEITETAAMTDIGNALEVLARLNMKGFALSIDDYGTGFSSLQQLTRVPFSELKIDQSFVKDIDENEGLRIIVKSSIDLAQKLNCKSVAEGVETLKEWEILKEMGCNIAQGYFIAKPMGFVSFKTFIKEYEVL
jgi:EAL domain-containing protein (putative c-di-GMP-specific phosphodiesterase class I)/ActR/RegA family two-component response regulator